MLKVKITDKEALEGLELERVTQYLNEHGWKKSRITYNQIADYWNINAPYGDGELLEVIVPRVDTRDKVLQLSDVITACANVENRSQLDVYYEMQGRTSVAWEHYRGSSDSGLVDYLSWLESEYDDRYYQAMES